MLTKVLAFYDEYASVMNDFQEEELVFACTAAQPAEQIETADAATAGRHIETADAPTTVS